MPTPTDIDTDAVRAVAEELSLPLSTDVLDHCLNKIAELETKTTPETHLTQESTGHQSSDEHNALLDIYKEPRSTTTTGPLAGTTFAIKDNIIVKHLQLTCGLTDFTYVPDTDAVVIDRLLAAGATITGKSNMDALAIGPGGGWSELGQVTNPTYPELYPGGSSSGSGAAVAAGLVDAALGSDTGGSVRKPATYCGLVGIKPTNGLVPLHGIIPMAPSLDTIGPIANTVTDAARILQTLSGYHPADPSSSRVSPPDMTENITSPKPLTIGIPDAFFDCAIEKVREELKRVRDTLTNTPHYDSKEVQLDNEPFNDIWPHIATGEFVTLLRNQCVQYGDGTWYDDHWYTKFADLLERGFNEHITYRELPWAYLNTKTNGRSYVTARETLIDLEQTVARLFDDVDILMTPAIPRLPPTLDTDLETSPHPRSINFKPFNLTGNPAVVVPTGEINGAPVSAQLIAPHFNDNLALQAALHIESNA